MYVLCVYWSCVQCIHGPRSCVQRGFVLCIMCVLSCILCVQGTVYYVYVHCLVYTGGCELCIMCVLELCTMYLVITGVCVLFILCVVCVLCTLYVQWIVYYISCLYVGCVLCIHGTVCALNILCVQLIVYYVYIVPHVKRVVCYMYTWFWFWLYKDCELQLISYKRYLECTLIQSRLSIYL